MASVVSAYRLGLLPCLGIEMQIMVSLSASDLAGRDSRPAPLTKSCTTLQYNPLTTVQYTFSVKLTALDCTPLLAYYNTRKSPLGPIGRAAAESFTKYSASSSAPAVATPMELTLGLWPPRT